MSPYKHFGNWRPGYVPPSGGQGQGLPAGMSGLAALAFLGRLALRALPWIGLGLTLYLLWKWFQTKPYGAGGEVNCGIGPGYRLSPKANPNCINNQGSQAWLQPGQTTTADYIAEWRFQPIVGGDWDTTRIWPNVNKYTGRRLKSHVGTAPGDPIPEQFGAGDPWVVPEPYWPTINPEPTPIAQPWPLPLPLPPAFTPLQPDVSPHSPEPVREEPFWPSPTTPNWPWPEPAWPGWPQPNPVPNPTPQPQPQPQPQPEPQPNPWPLPPPGPGTVGGTPIPPAVSFRPNRRPRFQPPQNRPRKPGRGTKEKKLILTPGAKTLLGVALNLATEGGDMVEAFWWALPKECRTKPTWNAAQKRWVRAGLAQMAADVYKCAEHVDGQKALENFISNQIGDFIGGKTGQATARANRNLWKQFGGSGFGLGRGPAL